MQKTKRQAAQGFCSVNISRSIALSLSMAILAFQTVQANEVLKIEKKLLSGLESIQNLSLDTALGQFSSLSKDYPNYKLAQLLKADLLALKAGHKQLLNTIHNQNPNEIARLKDEAIVRWNFSQFALQANSGLNRYVLKTAKQSYLILISLAESRLYVYQRDEDGQMSQVTDYYVTMGRKGAGKQREGDLKTPVGIYLIVDMLPDSQLPDLYGVGALPLNYPNKWDRQNGKTGSGIWLHGTPSDTYIRAPRASKGCVVLNNTAMQTLLKDYELPVSTPVVIVDDAKPFLTPTKDMPNILTEVKQWVAQQYGSAIWDSVSVYRYPNEEALFYVTFPTGKSGALMHQFWQRDKQGTWELLTESTELIAPKKVSKKTS